MVELVSPENSLKFGVRHLKEVASHLFVNLIAVILKRERVGD